MAIVKSTKLIEGEKPEEVINVRNKHAGYRRRGEKKSKIDDKFLEFQFNITYELSEILKVPKGWIDDFEKLIYNMVVDNIDETELRDTISSDPTLADVSEEMDIKIDKKDITVTPSVELMKKWLDDITIEFKVLPEFAWRDVYNDKVKDFRSTTYFYTGIIYPSRKRNSHINPTKEQERLNQ